jgi:hypothetical protein
VADVFRDIAAGLRDTNFDRTESYDGQNRRDRTKAFRLGTAKSANQAKQIFAEVESETARIRRTKSKKYDINFLSACLAS